MLLLRLPTRATIFRTLTTATLPSPQIPLLNELRVLCTRGHITEALSLFYTDLFPHNYLHHHQQQIYSTLFHACAIHRHLSHGKALHHHILTHNPVFPNDPFDLCTTNHIINMYAKCGCLENARNLFDEMPQRNVVSWTAVISGYAQEGRSDECFGLFVDMLVHCRPNEFAYASVLSVCDGCRGRQVHGVVVKTCFDEYVYVGNVLITMYWRNGGNDGNEAWRVFDGLRVRNSISWNSMICGFQKRGEWVEALRFFCLMRHYGVGFDRATLLGVIGSLCCGSGSDVCLVLGCCFQLHCLSIKSGFMSNIEVATALTKAYSDLGGEVVECYDIFLETSGHRDVVSWTGIMTTFSEQNPEEVVFLYRQFCREGFSPDRYTYSILLKACAGLVTERHASAVHSQIMKSGFGGDTVLGNSLIHAYARTGSIAKSKKVFDDMRYRDTVSWNSMLKAYGLHGQAKEALCIFAQMNAQPDATTFVALLSACSHAGLVDEGTKIFDTMVENYGIVPQLDHYACMIDILGRAGRIFEAEKLIYEMPMAPDPVVWTTLLAACRKHGETDLANLAVKKLMELDPQKSLGYVLMSNIYFSTGNFNEAGLVRKDMKGLGVRKQPGLSWTEIGNCVHEFASGGLRHPQAEAIHDNLKELVKRLKGMGYVPETSLALYDVEEEHKAEQLYYHSEKLALVFALMNTGGFHSNGGVIRIIKNIRTCADCHNFMKFASELVQREIVVRDSNRFHHFKDRLCSCNDYW